MTTQDILDRLVLTLVNESARCIQEKVVAKPAYLDMAMIMGAGFPPFRGGVCAFSDTMGVTSVVKRLDELSALFGQRFSPAPLLEELSKSNREFYT